MCAHCDFIVLDKCGVCSDVSDVRSCVWALVSVSYLCCRQTEVQDVQDGLHTRDNWIPTVEQASRTILVFPLLQTQLQCQAHTTWGWLDFRSVAAEQCCNVLLNIWARKRLEKNHKKTKQKMAPCSSSRVMWVACEIDLRDGVYILFYTKIFNVAAQLKASLQRDVPLLDVMLNYWLKFYYPFVDLKTCFLCGFLSRWMCCDFPETTILKLDS